MTNLDSWIFSYLLNSLWQIPLLFAAGWLAARIVRSIGAAAEHGVWVAVLLLQSLLPALCLLPWHRLGALLPWSSTAHGGVQFSVDSVAGAGIIGFALPGIFILAITATYGLVCTYFLARFIWRCGRLNVIRGEATEIHLDGEAALGWSECQRRFGVARASIAVSSRLFGPVTLGVTRKLLLLPARMAANLELSDFRTVIAHEFAHMRRNDFLKNLFYELLSVPASYHPLFRLTRERVMESREMVCDQMAAGFDGRSRYARSLLRLASLLVTGAPARVPHTIGIFDANTFERRVMKLATERIEMTGAQRLAVVVACAALGLATCGTAMALGLRVNAAAETNVYSTATADKPVPVSPGIVPGHKLSGPAPKYPLDAKKMKIQGIVILQAVINKTGDVVMLHVISGPAPLQQSAMDAVKDWKFSPFLKHGKPVSVTTKIQVDYKLR